MKKNIKMKYLDRKIKTKNGNVFKLLNGVDTHIESGLRTVPYKQVNQKS